MKREDDFLIRLHDAAQVVHALPSLEPQALDLSAGYTLQREALRRRQAAGERLTGWKVAFAGRAAQDRFGIDEPVLGALTDAMAVEPGSTVPLARLIQPKLEIELAFVLGRTLVPDFYSDEDILAAISEVAPAFEIADCRWQGWRFGVGAFLADNAAAGLYCLGARVGFDPDRLPEVNYRLVHDGGSCGEGNVLAREDTPLANLCWLVRRLLADGQRVEAGQVVLSGALLAPMDVRAGEYRLHMLGTELALVFRQ
ncbi:MULTISPECIES: 2-keto-4-pentenoate hydratase [Pseudomonas]|uniref:Putative lyase n=2 Tax=Pseudomonas brassicacearum TaxID=930166 RepID=F2KGU1_PSEBN|nr:MULTISPECIES: 2-keto-4-pentenoate hydratase [Pseudomonas]KIR14642.1 2-hydroxyhexa-2,4-dienoate hydratase [Pseudomonas fluorescens]AEA68630.1 putative lyase [Pseudomonas brassicacearum subsp. brassicacearum NFM421]ALQ03198.1 2-keto-4-pentenoate hydratase [Pseudomonas brassicacearum]AOS38036.1 2-keto-4-pentenoate hydratase [Pseudomonas brassicacearum]ROM86419.1 2-keto-4-pentenoate hydratase [Pseudomonas brassicacearum]